MKIPLNNIKVEEYWDITDWSKTLVIGDNYTHIHQRDTFG